MKKESNGKKKSLLWLWILIGVVAVLAIAGGILAFLFLGQPEEEAEPEKVFFELYLNVDRDVMVEAETGMSAREPAEDGMYHVRLSVNGELTEVSVADKKLVNRMDMLDVFGLKFDAEGNVVDLIAPEEYYTKIADKAYVQFIEGNTITVNTSQALSGMQIKFDLNSDCIVTDATPRAEEPGGIGELEIMDQVLVYGLDGETPSDLYILDRFLESDVYWRVERKYSTTTKKSTRTQAEDGYWYVDFAVNGKQVTLRTNIEEVINAIDGYGVNTACCGLVFDEEGNIIDCFNAAMAARGYVAANSYDVTELSEDGKTFTVTRLLTGSSQGKTYTGTITEDTRIYNVNSTHEKFVGEVTELQKDDRLYVIADTYGNPKIIYVVNRMVDSPMYYLQNRTYSSAKGCTATPDANGWYTLKFTAKGKEYVYKTKDFDLVSEINAYNYQLMGLQVKNGIVKNVYDPQCVSGYYSFAPKYFVTGYADPLLSCTSTSGTVKSGLLAADVEIYDVSGLSKFVGAKTTVRMGDRVVCYTNTAGEVSHVYILNRKVEGTTLFWKLESAQYDSAKKVTTRTPDKNGYYTYQVIKAGGKEMTVKTKSKTVASQMDSYSSSTPVALKVNSKGILSGAYPGWAWNGGTNYRNRFWVTSKVAAELNTYMTIASTNAEGKMRLQDNCKIYNVSTIYNKYRGESTTLKVGDRIWGIAGQDGKAQVVFVYQRDVNTQVYRRLSHELNKETGVYTFKLAVNGAIKTYTCSDEAVAQELIDQSVGFGLKLSGTKILKVYPAGSAPAIRGAITDSAYYDVAKISGKTVYLKRNKPGQTDTGKTAQITLASNCKVYMWDRYTTVDGQGKAAKLQVGDRIYAYANMNGEAALIYIENECTHANGGYGYCPHCGKTVWWEPLNSAYNPVEGHIPSAFHCYLSADLGRNAQHSLYDDDQENADGKIIATTAFVLDLYGNTRTVVAADETVAQNVLDPEGNPVLDAEGKPVTETVATGRRVCKYPAVRVGNNNSLLIIDTKGGGSMKIEKDAVITGATGLVRADAGSKVTINAGTYDASMAISEYTGANGGTLMAAGDVVVNGGTIIGPKSVSTASGKNTPAIGSWSGSTVTINGGTIKAATDGDNYIGSAGGAISVGGDLTIKGGTIIGGKVRNEGGAIYGGSKTNLIITGGVIKGGYAGTNGGNIFNKGPMTDISGCTITGGKAVGQYGSNLYVSGNGVVAISDKAVIDGGVAVRGNGIEEEELAVLLLHGEIDLDKTGNANTFYDILLENAGAAVVLDPEDLSTSKAYLVTDTAVATPVYQGKTIVDLTFEAYVQPWTEWTDSTTLPATGKVKLMTNISADAMATVADSLILDLNGYDITRTVAADSTDSRVFDVDGTLQILDSSTDVFADQGVISASFEGENVCEKNAGLIVVSADASFILDGGILDGSNITSTYATAHSGVVSVLNASKTVAGYDKKVLAVGEFTMNGGIIKGLINDSGKRGSCVMGAGGTKITINGGELIAPVDGSNKVTAGGVAVAANGFLTINGGKLTGGYTTTGGAIYNGSYTSATSVMEDNTPVSKIGQTVITGGEIIGGIASGNGDSIYVTGMPLSITGDAAITGDIALNGAGAELLVADQISLTDGTITFIGEANYYIGSLEADAQAAVVGAEYELEYTSGNVSGLKIVSGGTEPEPEPDPGTAQWTEWTSTTSLPTTAGNYRLTANVTTDGIVEIKENVVIDLHGNNITRTVSADATKDTYVFKVNNGGALTITDLSGKPEDQQGVISLSTAVTTSAPAGLVYVLDADADTSFTLNGGILDGSNITATYSDADNGVVTTMNNNTGVISTVTVNGGIIKGQKSTSTTTGKSASCIGANKESVVVINGGTFKPYGEGETVGTFYASGAVDSCGDALTINGGTFYGTRAKGRGAVVAMSGGTGNLTITGGTFYGGNALTGGTIHINSSGTHSITGGVFVDGTARTAAQGHTLDLRKGTITIGGNAVIYGGVSVADKAKLVVTGTPVINKELGSGVDYNINLVKEGQPIYLNTATGTALTTAVGDYSLTYGADGKVNGITATVAQTEWTETTSLPTTGSIKLTAPVTITEKVTLTGNLTVDLNGQSITRTVAAGGTDALVFEAPAGTMLTILDSSATPATIAATFADPADKVNTPAGLIYLATGANGYIADVTVDGSNITSSYADNHNGVVTTDGLLIIDGATIKGQRSTALTASGKSGSVLGGWANSHIILNSGKLLAIQTEGTDYGYSTGGGIGSKGDVTINGGEIIGGRARNHGGTIYLDSAIDDGKTLTINGGTIRDGFANNNGGNISAKIQSFVMNGGTIMGGTIGKTTTVGPNIDVNGGTQFTINGGTIVGGLAVRSDTTKVTVNGGTIDCTGSNPAVDHNINLVKGTISVAGNETTTAGQYSVTYDCMGNVNNFVAGTQAAVNGAHTGTAGSACTACGKTIA